MKSWIIDYHNSATRDIGMILSELGCEVKRESLSNHMWAFGEEKSNLPLLKDLELSKFDFDIGKKFQTYLEKELKEYDFFVTGHTPCLSLLFSETNKPVIVLISTRYEHPFTGHSEKWKKFNDYLQEKHQKRQFFYIANNHYDAEYFYYYTGIRPKIIQSLCHYNKNKWNKREDKWIIDSRVNIANDNLVSFKGRKYSWEEFYKYAGVFYIPYQVSTMSLFEHTAAGIPVKYPGIDETIQLVKQFPGKVLSEISWRQVSHEYSNVEYQKIEVYGELPNPNDLSYEMLKEWLPFSDAYSNWMDNIITNSPSKDLLNNNQRYALFKQSYNEILDIIK